MKQLIINADDFGRHTLINEAIEKAFREGCLTSTTIMAGGKAFEGAVDIAHRNQNLGVGVHLTLANGFPILPPKKIPTLVTEDGFFHPNYTAFLKLYLRGKINSAEIYNELEAQIEKIHFAGIRPTHFDSHQHLHHIPAILGIALKLAKKFRIPAMRVSSSKVFDGSVEDFGQFIGRLGLSSLAKIATSRAQKEKIVMPDHFLGIVAGESIDKNSMLNMLDKLEEGTTEIMIHPGTDNKILQTYTGWNHNFEAELDAVTSPKILNQIDAKKIKLINFGDLRVRR